MCGFISSGTSLHTSYPSWYFFSNSWVDNFPLLVLYIEDDYIKPADWDLCSSPLQAPDKWCWQFVSQETFQTLNTQHTKYLHLHCGIQASEIKVFTNPGCFYQVIMSGYKVGNSGVNVLITLRKMASRKPIRTRLSETLLVVSLQPPSGWSIRVDEGSFE